MMKNCLIILCTVLLISSNGLAGELMETNISGSNPTFWNYKYKPPTEEELRKKEVREKRDSEIKKCKSRYQDCSISVSKANAGVKFEDREGPFGHCYEQMEFCMRVAEETFEKNYYTDIETNINAQKIVEKNRRSRKCKHNYTKCLKKLYQSESLAERNQGLKNCHEQEVSCLLDGEDNNKMNRTQKTSKKEVRKKSLHKNKDGVWVYD